ncbi:MFS transporter, partial [Enterococcus faecalis]|nr:MFS transporter [Enterococcus faecalis]
MFTIGTFSWGNLTATTVAIGEFALLFVLPLYLINAYGTSVIDAGLILAAMALGAFISGGLARHIAARLGPAGTVILGLGLELAGVAALAYFMDP